MPLTRLTIIVKPRCHIQNPVQITFPNCLSMIFQNWNQNRLYTLPGFYDSCISYLIINFFVRVKKQTQSEIQRRTCEDSMPAVIFGGRGNMHGGKNEWKKTRRK